METNKIFQSESVVEGKINSMPFGTWNNDTVSYEKMPEKILEFLKEIEQLYRKYNLSIAHEDGQGSFIIEEYSRFNLEWLCGAYMNIHSEDIYGE